MIRHYILDESGETIAVDMLTWARWFESAGDKRVLKRDELPDDICISTVFLGLDHNFYDDGPPLIWETMIFGGPHDQYQYRYSTREEALAGHERALELAKRVDSSTNTE